ncbi:MAG: agmatinase [Chloroflexi bacterium]|nr:agmatinase [Chloroflexota bacterium]
MKPWNDPFPEKTAARIAILDLASDENSSYLTGTSEAPPLIHQAFHSPSSNLWTEGGIDLGKEGLFVDGEIIHKGREKEWDSEIETLARRILEQDLRLLALGGDHSVTFPLLRAMAKKFPNLSILHFDAHPDLYDQFEGNPHSHASPFARIMEQGLAQRLVQVGIRTMNGHQKQQAERFGVEVIPMQDFRDDLVLHFSTPVYISFDLDALDPAFAPGVSHWEPGGLSTRQALRLIQALDAPLVAADIVEFNPRVESQITARVAAKLMKELSGKMLADPK